MDKAAVEIALGDLKRAIAEKHVEPICAAYQELRTAAGIADRQRLFDLAAHAIHEEIGEMVVSAYSHRKCFMCEKGSIACDICGGTGRCAGQPCGSCGGLGLAECLFCRGTGWTEADTVPSELRHLVRARQLAHVMHDAGDFHTRFGDDMAMAVARLHEGNRRSMAMWLLRLRGRIAMLGGEGLLAREGKAEELNAVAEKIPDALKALAAR